MHPNGQTPAYEWAFGDVNPPLFGWAALRVYQIERLRTGTSDRQFLHRVFHKLLLNFTWWVNRKDAQGNNIFQGGFLGLDNIGIFDRSAPLPPGVSLGQSDGTSWMAVYCANLFRIATELAVDDPTYEDLALKFYEHFLAIAHAMSHRGRDGMSLWDEEDGFFYDVVRLADGEQRPIKVRSLVGLIPLLATEVADGEKVDRLPGLKERMRWVAREPPRPRGERQPVLEHGQRRRVLASVVKPEQLRRILKFMLDENEFLSPHGIRSVSKVHQRPYTMSLAGGEYTLDYEPGESTAGLFGGNSNWRGPDLDAAQLPPDRGAPAVRLLSRRGLHGGVSDRLGQDDDPVGGGRGALASPHPPLPARRRRTAARSTAAEALFDGTRTGATSCSSTSTSTPRTAAGSAPVTRRAGQRSSPSSCSNREPHCPPRRCRSRPGPRRARSRAR